MTRPAVAATALAFMLAGCARSGGGEPAEPHVLRIADNVDPSSLNPLLAHDQDTIGYDLLVTQTLVGLSAENRLVPVLVTRVPSQANGDISRDGRTIVYRLRHRVRFADGTELTSADVAFTFRAILDPRNPVESQDAYRRVESLQTPNRYTVVVRLQRRWNAAVAELFAQADFAFGILPAHAFASTDVTRAAWNERPFGTGPFKVVEWERASRIVLEPNPYYRPRPRLHRIVFAMIPTRQAALLALQTRAIDVAEIDATLVRQARSVAGARVVTTPINGLDMLLLQSAAPPTGDLHVRRAIAAATDRTELTRALLGTVTPADSFVPPVLAWHDPDPRAIVAGSSAVVRELSGDGWRKNGEFWTKAGNRLSVTIVFPAVMPAPVLEQEQLRHAGIEAWIKPYTATLFNAPGGPLRSGNFTIAEAEWIGGADPEQSVIFACSQRGSDGNNSMNYCSAPFDARFADQATTSDPLRRRRDFIEMQRIVRRDVPAVPLYFESEIDIVRDRVSGFRRNMLMYPVGAEEWDTR
ncbi:MAG TPA: peptide ABC transporter substrate-binding protein [Candidatus Cybelea sp.]|nr:peptide ABC transporter substrate-binding protein [Candidatus Cybelea sp.]